jgi:hypothetical protein
MYENKKVHENFPYPSSFLVVANYCLMSQVCSHEHSFHTPVLQNISLDVTAIQADT